MSTLNTRSAPTLRFGFRRRSSSGIRSMPPSECSSATSARSPLRPSLVVHPAVCLAGRKQLLAAPLLAGVLGSAATPPELPPQQRLCTSQSRSGVRRRRRRRSARGSWADARLGGNVPKRDRDSKRRHADSFRAVLSGPGATVSTTKWSKTKPPSQQKRAAFVYWWADHCGPGRQHKVPTRTSSRALGDFGDVGGGVDDDTGEQLGRDPDGVGGEPGVGIDDDNGAAGVLGTSPRRSKRRERFRR